MAVGYLILAVTWVVVVTDTDNRVGGSEVSDIDNIVCSGGACEIASKKGGGGVFNIYSKVGDLPLKAMWVVVSSLKWIAR